MAEITAALVKELREKTGAGMMDCKKALTENNGDIEASVDWLRKKGLSQAAKKAGRVAAEGLIGVAASGPKEQNGDAEKIKTAKVGGATIADKLTNLVATIGENMSLRRGVSMQVKNGVVASYVHSAVSPGLGKIGVLVAIESTGDPAKLQALGKQIAMHVAAANPQSLSITEVDPAALKRERDILTEQAMASGRPANVIEKMVEGRLRKYYEETVLLEQLYVVDGESRVSAVVEKAAKDVGAPVTIAGFRRFALGEGIERKESDFAAEVAAQAQIGR